MIKRFKTAQLQSLMIMGLLMSSSIALAHVDGSHHHHTSGLWSGFLHPWSGLDHMLLAMGLGVILARFLGLGLLFLSSSLVVGFVIALSGGFAGVATESIEWAIVASVIVTMVAMFMQNVLPQKKAVFSMLFLVSAFCLTLFHGVAHALEMPSADMSLSFASGMILGMSSLFLIGAGAMRMIQRVAQQRPVMHYSPSVLAVCGLALLWLN